MKSWWTGRPLQACRLSLVLISQRISNSCCLKIFQPSLHNPRSLSVMRLSRRLEEQTDQKIRTWFFRISSTYTVAGLWRSVEQTAWPRRFRWSQYFWTAQGLSVQEKKTRQSYNGKLQKSTRILLWELYNVTYTQLKFFNSERVNSFHDVIIFPFSCCSQLMFHQVYTFIVRRKQMPI